MITWWCTALAQPWTWEWIAYPGIWLAVFVPTGLYIRAVIRAETSLDGKKMAQFLSGMLVFWLASDWPLGTLSAGYLASAHMTQFLLYTLVAAPLVILGIPRWLFERILEITRLRGLVMRLGRSVVVAGAVYNLVLIGTHAPGTVEALRTSQFGSFAMDILWVIAGIVLWLPVISPIPEGQARSPASKMGYLFLTTSVVAVIPASFLTFTQTPIYGIYELAPRVTGLSALEDQQLAGIIMKIATIPIVWSTIAVLWFRWTAHEAQTA